MGFFRREINDSATKNCLKLIGFGRGYIFVGGVAQNDDLTGVPTNGFDIELPVECFFVISTNALFAALRGRRHESSGQNQFFDRPLESFDGFQGHDRTQTVGNDDRLLVEANRLLDVRDLAQNIRRIRLRQSRHLHGTSARH